MSTQILVGDALSRLRDMPDGSVHCCVTSPPYWGLRAYRGDPGMIGLEPTFDEHLENLVDVFREVRRVLRSDGTLWLNYGDAYCAGSARTAKPTYRPELVSGSGKGIGCTSWGHRDASMGADTRGSSLKPKDLMMRPAICASSRSRTLCSARRSAMVTFLLIQAQRGVALASLRPPRPNPAPSARTVSGVRLSAASAQPVAAVERPLLREGLQVVKGAPVASRCRHRHALALGSVVLPADSRPSLFRHGEARTVL